MRVAFIGTEEIGAIALRAVAKSGHDVVLVVTQPDRPRGRGRKIAPGLVRIAAEELEIPLMQPESIREDAARKALTDSSPDILTVVSYGEYIPESVYSTPPYRAINVHPSLLPRWRGASPVRYALLSGDAVTGVTIQYIAKRMDAGDILLQREVSIDPEDDHGSLCAKLYPLGAELLVEALDGLAAGLAAGTVSARPQDSEQVTKAPKIGKDDPWLDWGRPATKVRNRIRAFSPKPGARTMFRDADCKMLAAPPQIEPLEERTEPGMIVELGKDGPRVACGDGALTIVRLQPAGKKALNGRDFLNGYRPEVGERFERIIEGSAGAPPAVPLAPRRPSEGGEA